MIDPMICHAINSTRAREMTDKNAVIKCLHFLLKFESKSISVIISFYYLSVNYKKNSDFQETDDFHHINQKVTFQFYKETNL